MAEVEDGIACDRCNKPATGGAVTPWGEWIDLCTDCQLYLVFGVVPDCEGSRGAETVDAALGGDE